MSNYGASNRSNQRPSTNKQQGPTTTTHRSKRTSNIDSLPTETGKIHSLLENFGFIYCAERASDLFFHYSEVRHCSVADLNLGDEVQFKVGPSSSKPQRSGNLEKDENQGQMAAFRVEVLSPGTVQWEVEDEPKGVRRRGRVEKMIRFHSNNSRDMNSMGTIRLEATSIEGTLEHASQKNVLVRFAPNDYQGYSHHSSNKGGVGSIRNNPNKSSSSRNELETGDVVEFTLVTEKRSGLKFARDITLLQSERQRLEEEHENKLLETASREQGIVVSLKNGFGFLKSNKRREEVYFHFSNIELPNDEDEGEHVLKEGQDMEFLVVEDANKISARQVVFLPKGSVVFEVTLGENVTGKLTIMPNLSTSSRRSNKDIETPGKIELNEAISVENDGNIDIIREVDVYPDDIQHLIREEVWIRPGDTLLFDVVKSLIDDRYRAAPVQSNQKKGMIRIIKPCLAGRAEGVVVSLKDNFGFIQLAQRKIDVYFRTSDVFPIRVQKDMLNGTENGHPLTDEIKLGMEVSFDLSLVSSELADGGRGRSSKKRAVAVKESNRAKRLLILPPGSIASDKIYPSVTGSIIKVEKINKFCGTVKLDEKMVGMTILERNPLLKRLFDEFETESSSVLHFNDVQSEIENDTILQAAEERGGLEVIFTPVAEFGTSNRGRISLHKKDVSTTVLVDDTGVEESLVMEEENDSVKSDDFCVTNAGEDLCNVQDVQIEVDDSINMDDQERKSMTNSTVLLHKRKKLTRAFQMLSYDKTSVSSLLVNDHPPNVGDKVKMDLTYSCGSGKFTVSNMDVVERCSDKSSSIKYNLCEGYILLEPRHTSLLSSSSMSKKRGFKGGDEERWGTTVNETEHTNDDGFILLLKDPANLFKRDKSNIKLPKGDFKDETSQIENECIEKDVEIPRLLRIPYTLSSVGGRSTAVPKRGDLVSFVRGKNSSKARDVQVLETGVALRIKGKLVNFNEETESAIFISDASKSSAVNFSDVLGCDIQMLKDGVAVEGIEYGDYITGICRYDDLYLTTTVGTGLKERPKLNLTVKKELKDLGGNIIAQSGMAKGPDGTSGFAEGWTSRVSKFNTVGIPYMKPVDKGDAAVEDLSENIQDMSV